MQLAQGVEACCCHEHAGDLRARRPRGHDHLQPARLAQRHQRARCGGASTRRSPLPRRRGGLGRRSSPAPADAFCAGGDIRDGAGAAGEFGGTFWEKPTINSFESGWEIFKPVIAAVNGYCLGYGLTLVTWCDFVIASERAEFGFPEVRIGVPTIVGAIRLPQTDQLAVRDGAAPDRRAHRPPTGQGDRPGRAGSSRHDELMAEPPVLGRSAGGGRAAGGPRQQGGGGALASLPSVEAIRFGETMRLVALATDDAREGIRAAAEKREPRWRAR